MTRDGSNIDAAQLLPFSDIADRLPAASWIGRHAKEFTQSKVLLLEGDSELAALDLGALHKQGVLLLLVTGNLTVTGAIHNEETDGASGLVVLGNLTAGHMIVGGQEIYVCGQLDVGGLFWGDYNHGEINVQGRTSAQFWLATEEYHSTLEGGIGHIATRWDDDSYDYLPPPLCRATLLPWFVPELIDTDGAPDDRLGGWLSRDDVIEAACAGKPILVPRMPQPGYPPRLLSDVLCAANLQSLLQTPLREGVPRSNIIQMDAHPFFRLTFPGADTRGSIYFETSDRRYYAKVDVVESGAQTTTALVVEVSNETGDKAAWRELSAAETEAEPTLQAAWREWLGVLAEAEPLWQQLSQAVTVERIEALLDLPFVRENFPTYDDDREYGPYSLSVRQADEGTPRLSFGWMGSDTRDDDGDREYCWAQFAIKTTEEGHKQAAVQFQPDTIGATVYDARLYLRRLGQIWNAFQAIEAIVSAEETAR